MLYLLYILTVCHHCCYVPMISVTMPLECIVQWMQYVYCTSFTPRLIDDEM